MRFSTILFGTGFLMAALLAAGAASAAAGKEGAKGGGGGPAGGGGPGGGSGGAGPAEQERINPDAVLAGEEAYKRWEIESTFETHRLIRQSDLAGGYADPKSDQGYSGARKLSTFNYLLIGARYDLTPANDRLRIRGGVYQYFLADPGETGFRGDDILTSYTHYFYLKDEFTLRVSPAFTIPISYDSQ
jgi:hypothetical protein